MAVELKALGELEDIHLAQAINYLEAYNLDVGLLFNFGGKSLEFKRLSNPRRRARNIGGRVGNHTPSFQSQKSQFRRPHPSHPSSNPTPRSSDNPKRRATTTGEEVGDHSPSFQSQKSQFRQCLREID